MCKESSVVEKLEKIKEYNSKVVDIVLELLNVFNKCDEEEKRIVFSLFQSIVLRNDIKLNREWVEIGFGIWQNLKNLRRFSKNEGENWNVL